MTPGNDCNQKTKKEKQQSNQCEMKNKKNAKRRKTFLKSSTLKKDKERRPDDRTPRGRQGTTPECPGTTRNKERLAFPKNFGKAWKKINHGQGTPRTTRNDPRNVLQPEDQKRKATIKLM